MNGSDDCRKRFHQRRGIVANGIGQPVALVSIEVHTLGERATTPRRFKEGHAIALCHGTRKAPAAGSTADNGTGGYSIAWSKTPDIVAYLHNFA